MTAKLNFLTRLNYSKCLKTRPFFLHIQSRFEQDYQVRIPMFNLNISSLKEGIVDKFLHNTQYNHTILMEPIQRDIYRYYMFKPLTLEINQKKICSVKYTSDRIKDLLPGYPREPIFARYMPEEIEVLLNRKEILVLDIRQKWESNLSKLNNTKIHKVNFENFEQFAYQNAWGNFEEIEKLLPEEFKDRDLKFVVVCGDGNFSELFAALLYGHGWNNASVLLGGLNGLVKHSRNSKFLCKNSMLYNPYIDLQKSISVDLKTINYNGKKIHIFVNENEEN